MCVSYEIRQKIQKLAFPDGVIWDKENKIPRTVSENSVLKLFRCISSAYVGGEDAEGHKKTGKTADFSGLVAEARLEHLSLGINLSIIIK